jgi:transcriptional regulator with XRE-family HTH domain
MAQEKLSISAVAERMGTGRTAVRRILDAKNTAITFRSMTRIAKAVGLEIKLIAEPMPSKELGKLARRLARAKDRAQASKLTDKIIEGFYGEA